MCIYLLLNNEQKKTEEKHGNHNSNMTQRIYFIFFFVSLISYLKGEKIAVKPNGYSTFVRLAIFY